jgi:aspartate kinase
MGNGPGTVGNGNDDYRLRLRPDRRQLQPDPQRGILENDSFVVMKFGGTSVADASAISRVIDIVRDEVQRTGLPPVVIVSAMASVTDGLLALAQTAADGDRDAATRDLEQLRQRHLDVTFQLIPETATPNLRSDLERSFDDLRAIATAISVLREASPRSLDAVASAGELLSSRIVAEALNAAGVAAQFVDARRAIVTDDGYPAAPIVSETRNRVGREVLPHLRRGLAPVIGGFVGATVAGVTTTLGRGGSDFSAAIVGAALHGLTDSDQSSDSVPAPALRCREIQIWTDVDGMLTADPRIVQNPSVVPRLSFAEASELAYFGAKVLHPSTILPAVQADIPVRILNSRNPAASGTVISAAPSPDRHAVAALACKRQVTVVEITSTRMLMAHGFLRRLFQVFETHRTAVDVVTTSEVSVSVTVDDARELKAIVKALEEFAEVSVERGMAILCAVGDSLRGDPRLAIRLLGALDGVPLRMVSQAASRRNLTVVLNERDLLAAMSRLHEASFATEGLVAAGRGEDR